MTLLLATLALPASGASATPPTLELLNQSSTTVADGTFSLTLQTSLPAVASEYGLRATLYPVLSNRTEFGSSLGSGEPAGASCLSQTPILPLAAAEQIGNRLDVPLQLHVVEAGGSSHCATSSTQLMLDCTPGGCAGVYPVQIALIDQHTGKSVRSFTTHLIELDNASVEERLNVGVVLPLGSSLAIGPGGGSTLTSSALHHLAAIVATLTSHHALHLSLALYPQLIDAMQRSRSRSLTLTHRLEGLINRRVAHRMFELLMTPYAPVNTSALVAAGRPGTFKGLVELGNRTWLDFHLPSRDSRYLVPASLTSGGESLLAASCLNSIVLPASTALSTANGLTQTAPVGVPAAAHCSTANQSAATAAFIADPAAATLSSAPNDPMLEAHHFLAALAQIFFEQPGLPRRAVVVTPPESISPVVLDQVLTELDNAAFINTETLGSQFAQTPIGANGNTTAITLPSSTQGSNALLGPRLARAEGAVRVVASMVPTNTALLALMRRDIELGETAGLSAATRSKYLGAPDATILTISRSLSFLGPHNFTLTSSNGKIPLTLDQSGSLGPINVHIRLQSSNLILPNGDSEVVTLRANATSLANVLVDTRGSGSALLTVTVLSPTDDRLLLSGQFTVRSTAISLAAVLLSGLALAVLALWWIQSFQRRRRRGREAVESP